MTEVRISRDWITGKPRVSRGTVTVDPNEKIVFKGPPGFELKFAEPVIAGKPGGEWLSSSSGVFSGDIDREGVQTRCVKYSVRLKDGKELDPRIIVRPPDLQIEKEEGVEETPAIPLWLVFGALIAGVLIGWFVHGLWVMRI